MFLKRRVENITNMAVVLDLLLDAKDALLLRERPRQHRLNKVIELAKFCLKVRLSDLFVQTANDLFFK